MMRLSSWVLLATITAAGPKAAFGQADARAAFDAGKQAYQAGQFDKARDQFIAASNTDNKNPEVFLWLGKAQYELGNLDEAIVAWTTTLKFAPNEPYATKMLAALRGNLANADNATALIDILLKEQLFELALRQAEKTLADKGLTDAQRIKVSTQKAAALIALGAAREVPALVHELLIKYPNGVDAAQASLLLGRAYVRMGGDKTAEGLALLKKVTADFAASPAAVVAQHELILLDIDQGVTAAKVDSLAKWIVANPQHAMTLPARVRLVDAYLALAAQSAPVKPDAALGKEDAAAIAAASDVYRQTVFPADADNLTRRIVGSIDARYAKAKAYAAAAAAMDQLLKAPLPRSSRLIALRTAAGYRGEMGLTELTTSITASGGAGLKNELPKPLADVVAMLDAIATEFPAEGAWKEQAALSERIRGLAAAVNSPAMATELKAPLSWAVQIALPVVKAGVDDAATGSALNTIAAVVNEAAALHEPQTRGLAATINAQLLAAVPADNANWINVAWRQVDLLDALALAEFQENTRAGNAAANAQLNAAQQQLVAALGKIVARNAALAGKAIDRLSAHLQPWLAQGHYAMAEGAFTQLGQAMPQSQRILSRLAIVRLSISQVVREHERLLAAGLTPPKQLDPALRKALDELYALQADLTEADPLIVDIRGVWNSVLNHYKKLEFYEVVEQALSIHAPRAIANSESFEALQLANLRREAARRQLEQMLKQFNGAQKLTLTPAYKTAIEAYQKFITDFPGNPHVDTAADAIFAIAASFERYQAFDVAAEIYKNFAAFAARQKPLAESTPASTSLAERAEFAAASAIDAKARAALSKLLAERKPDSPPPAKLSDEFAAAIAAFKDFIKAHPNSALLGGAIQKIMTVALDYARADAWDVADAIYADLMGSNLALRNPERFEFARALCQIGKALPEHAVQILSTLTFGQPPRGARPISAEGAVALGGDDSGGIANGPADGRSFGVAGGGRGRGGGGGFGGRAGVSNRGAGGDSEAAPPGETPAGVTALALQPNASADLATDFSKADQTTLAAITQQEQQRAQRVAQLRDSQFNFQVQAKQQAEQKDQLPQQQIAARAPVLSDAEIARLEGVFDLAYKALKAIRDKYPTSITADQARGEILVLVAHWETLAQWQKAAALAQRFLKDNPTDAQLPTIRMQVARDYLSWASAPPKGSLSRQEMLAEVSKRFDEARSQFAGIVGEFADDKPLKQQAQWEIATSFLTQARAVDAFSPTLARGQYVRAAKELQRVARQYVDHPNIASIPQMLWQIAAELQGRSYFEEAISVWTDLINFDPTHALAQQASPQIAAAYQNNLNRPLRAVEVYVEINAARGGADVNSQNAVFAIGSQLKDQKRWVEALSVLETFVDSFPRHPNAGQGLTMIGQIHQANEAWQDAIAAYKRVIAEFPSGAWVQEAKWSIAECTINLSQWRQAMEAYETFAAAYAKDPRAAEATRRIGILKDLARFQALVDEPGQRKAFDAQFQIASILQSQLANQQKAIIEYRKVWANWPQSHLADAAMYAVGQVYLGMGEIDKARQTLMALATQYPDRSLADDALVLVGKSYEDEATKLAGLTRGTSVVEQQERAQRLAYSQVQQAREENRRSMGAKVASLKKSGKADLAELEEASQAAGQFSWNSANFELAVNKAAQDVETLTARQLADRQDKINAALRKAVDAYAAAAKVPGGDKAGDALLRMAVIYDEQLKDSAAALATWKEIVNQFSGTAVAEEASWRIAQYYDRAGNWKDAVEAYKAFLRNYRRGPRAAQAQFSIAEGYEHLNQWVEAMDAYNNYLSNFPDGPLAAKAKEQISWIKTYRL